MIRNIVVIIVLVVEMQIQILAQADVPISVFGALPEIADASVSTDGKTVALLENAGNNTVVRFFMLRRVSCTMACVWGS